MLLTHQRSCTINVQRGYYHANILLLILKQMDPVLLKLPHTFWKWQSPHVSTCWTAPDRGRQTGSVAAGAGIVSIPFCMEHNNRYVPLGSIMTFPTYPHLKIMWCLESSNRFQILTINLDSEIRKCWVCFIDARKCWKGSRKSSSTSKLLSGICVISAFGIKCNYL